MVSLPKAPCFLDCLILSSNIYIYRSTDRSVCDWTQQLGLFHDEERLPLPQSRKPCLQDVNESSPASSVVQAGDLMPTFTPKRSHQSLEMPTEVK